MAGDRLLVHGCAALVHDVEGRVQHQWKPDVECCCCAVKEPRQGHWLEPVSRAACAFSATIQCVVLSNFALCDGGLKAAFPVVGQCGEGYITSCCIAAQSAGWQLIRSKQHDRQHRAAIASLYAPRLDVMSW